MVTVFVDADANEASLWYVFAKFSEGFQEHIDALPFNGAPYMQQIGGMLLSRTKQTTRFGIGLAIRTCRKNRVYPQVICFHTARFDQAVG